ncbi:MAG TPA: hypothetical protein VIU65_11520 [Pyrinomonadaceae bacterium]
MKRALITIALIWLAHSPWLGHPPASQINQALTSITIPFSGVSNLVVITASINGQGPFRFAIDTGSSAHV